MFNKSFQRGIDFVSGSLYGLLPLMAQMVLSWVVVKRSGLTIWGDFMGVGIWVNAAIAIVGWGTKDYLLKKLSEQPSQLYQNWNLHVASRSLLILSVVPLFFVFYSDVSVILGIVVWYVLAALGKHFEPIIFFEKSMTKVLLVEPLIYGLFCGFAWIYPSIISSYVLILSMALAQGLKLMYLMFLYRNWIQLKYLKLNREYWIQSFPYFLPVIAGFLFWKVDVLVGTYFLSPVELGKYSILQALLNVFPGMVTGGLSVYQKNYLRLSKDGTQRFDQISIAIGILGAIIFCSLGFLFLNLMYGFDFDVNVLVMSILQVIPFVFYYPFILKLMKYNHQNYIAWTATGLSLVGLILCMVFAQKATFMSVFTAFVLFQWMALVVYFLVSKAVLAEPRKQYILPF